MSLFAAVYWIASEGGAKDLGIEDHATWRSALEALLERVRSNDLDVTGRQSERDLPDKIEGHVFRRVLILPPYQNMQDVAGSTFNDEPWLELCPTVDPSERVGDKLFPGGGLRPAWIDLRVSGPDVARLWPFQEVPPAHPSKPPESAAANPRAGASVTDLQIFRARDCLWAERRSRDKMG